MLPFPLNHNITSQPKAILLHHKADWADINNTITNEMTKLHLDYTSTIETIDNFTFTLTSAIQNTIKATVKTIGIKHHQIGIDPIIRDQISKEKQLRNIWRRTRIQHYKREYNKLNNKIKHQIKTLKINNWHNKCKDFELKDLKINNCHNICNDH